MIPSGHLWYGLGAHKNNLKYSSHIRLERKLLYLDSLQKKKKHSNKTRINERVCDPVFVCRGGELREGERECVRRNKLIRFISYGCIRDSGTVNSRENHCVPSFITDLLCWSNSLLKYYIVSCRPRFQLLYNINKFLVMDKIFFLIFHCYNIFNLVDG